MSYFDAEVSIHAFPHKTRWKALALKNTYNGQIEGAKDKTRYNGQKKSKTRHTSCCAREECVGRACTSYLREGTNAGKA